MALVQGVRKAGARPNALEQMSLFHSSAPLQEKWRSKYRNRTGYTDSENSHKKYVAYERRKERAAHRQNLLNWRLHVTFDQIEGSFAKPHQQKDRRWSRRSFSSKKTNDWEAYLKYEGDWERFCRKFTNLSDFETGRPRSYKGRPKRMWHEWDSEDEDDEDEDEDDGWDDDPTFGTRYKKTKPRTASHSTSRPKPVVTIGQRADRIALGLPPAGTLTMEELKAAFRASALKWHPDRHQGSSKDTAEEKFKACGNAYRALCSALAGSNNRC